MENNLNLDAEITLENFNQYHYEVGEDFIDQNEHIADARVFGGWLLHKYPDKKDIILKGLNTGHVQELMEIVYESEGAGDGDIDASDRFYTDFAEFLNYTGACRRRVNEVLYEAFEHYESDEEDDDE